MDHSDHFLPEGLNSVRGLRFENMPRSFYVGMEHCSPECTTTGQIQTQDERISSMVYSIWDVDGNYQSCSGASNNLTR
jgi:hypothetical protein